MTRLSKLVTFMLLLALPTSCRKTPIEIRPGNTLITTPGTYKVAGENVTLKVWIDGGIVHYEVAKHDKPIIRSVEQASDSQRWFLCWDEQNRLWFESSDIGGYLWRTNSEGNYGPITVTDQPDIVATMPSMVFDNLPSFIQAKLKHLRKPNTKTSAPTP